MLAQAIAKAFATSHANTVVTAGDEDYEKLRRVWNGLADRRPTAIVRAHSVEDVQRTVRSAAEFGSLLAVRCGGHSIPGLSTCDGGIVLDLSALNRVTVDPVTRVAEVEGGALLGNLDRACAKFGLAVHRAPVGQTTDWHLLSPAGLRVAKLAKRASEYT